MRLAFLLTLAIFIAQIPAGQAQNKKTFYLKDGSILRGEVIENISGKTLKIKTAENKVYSIDQTDIDSVSNATKIKSNTEEPKNSKVKKEKYNGILEVGYVGGVGRFSYDRIMANFVNGVMVDNKVSIGLLTGVRYFGEEHILIPISMDVRYFMVQNKKASPYIGVSFGQLTNLKNGLDDSGILLSGKLGVSINGKNNNSIILGICYEYQEIRLESYNYYYGSVSSTHNNAHGIGLSVGISF